MPSLRNKLIAQGKYTEVVDELMIKILLHSSFPKSVKGAKISSVDSPV